MLGLVLGHRVVWIKDTIWPLWTVQKHISFSLPLRFCFYIFLISKERKNRFHDQKSFWFQSFSFIDLRWNFIEIFFFFLLIKRISLSTKMKWIFFIYRIPSNKIHERKKRRQWKNVSNEINWCTQEIIIENSNFFRPPFGAHFIHL